MHVEEQLMVIRRMVDEDIPKLEVIGLFNLYDETARSTL
jgi:hypothetical protein